MKREIKFRAWDDRNKRMIDPAIWFSSDMREVSIFNGVIYPEYDKAIWRFTVLMQFTGLKDKNGREIYEGDIVKCHDHPTGIDDTIGPVIFKNGAFMPETTSIILADSGQAWIEVIGNIHENPELLNK